MRFVDGADFSFCFCPCVCVCFPPHPSPLPMPGSTNPLSGAPGNVSAKASTIACLRDLGGAFGEVLADFEHDLVMHPGDRTAVDIGVK